MFKHWKHFGLFWNTSIDEFITVGVYQCRWGVTYSENTFPCQPPQIWPFTMKTLQERCIRTLFFFSETPAVLIKNWTACGATVEVAVCGRGPQKNVRPQTSSLQEMQSESSPHFAHFLSLVRFLDKGKSQQKTVAINGVALGVAF